MLNRYKIIYLMVIALFAIKAGGQTPTLAAWKQKVLVAANTATDENYLTSEEKNVIFYINLVRLNPSLFEKTILQEFLDSSQISLSKWTESLREELMGAKPMNPLRPMKDLYLEAKKHAKDMGLTGKTGHESSSGKSYDVRIKRLGKKYESLFENCQYGNEYGLAIVIDLLIDEDIDDIGHRKTLLNPAIQYIGTSIGPHLVYKTNCVQEFGDRIVR